MRLPRKQPKVAEHSGIDPEKLGAIRARAREMAAQAPPLTTEQIVTLRMIFANPAKKLVDPAPALSREQVDSIRGVITGGGQRE